MRHFACAVLVALLLPLFPAAGLAANKPVSIGFIYVSPVDEAGWSRSHDVARQALADLPGVTAMYRESVPEGRKAEQVIRELAEKNGVVFTTSFGYMEPSLKVAADFPDVIFLHCSGFKTAPNVSTYFARIYQARFLTGMAAGAMTKSNILGYAAAFPIPEVIRGINAFTLGARSVNPDAEVRVMWTKTWYDQTLEKETAFKLIDEGADVIAQHQDSPAAQIAAQERGVYSVGYHADMSAFAPDAHLVAAVWNWTPFYMDVLAKIRAGVWKSTQVWPGMESGIVDISAFGPMVPQAVKDAVSRRKAAIIKGEYAVFSGPVVDQNGRIRVKKGEVADDEMLLKMNWYVQGVTGVIQ